jgi:hypothetical protein
MKGDGMMTDHRLGRYALPAAIVGAAASIAVAQQCYINSGQNGCDFWIDLDTCPDIYLGGGACGVLGALQGQIGTSPTTVSCEKNTRTPDTTGKCYSVGHVVVSVTCDVPSGAACGGGGGGED